MSKKVKFAKFHAGLFLPGLGNIGETLPSQNKTLSDLTMILVPEGLLISAKGVDIVVPSANVVLMQLEEKYG